MSKKLEECLKHLSVRELKELLKFVDSCKSKKEIIKEIDRLLKEKESRRKKTLNFQYKLSTISTFSLEDREVLKKNKLKNMQDLIEVEIASLVGIDQITKESLEWAQKFYDLSKLDARQKKY